MKGSDVNNKAGRFAPIMKLILIDVHTTVGCDSFSFFLWIDVAWSLAELTK